MTRAKTMVLPGKKTKGGARIWEIRNLIPNWTPGSERQEAANDSEV